MICGKYLNIIHVLNLVYNINSIEYSTEQEQEQMQEQIGKYDIRKLNKYLFYDLNSRNIPFNILYNEIAIDLDNYLKFLQNIFNNIFLLQIS